MALSKFRNILRAPLNLNDQHLSSSVCTQKPRLVVLGSYMSELCLDEQILTLLHSDWVTGKRGRRNSVGSLDSTIEVSLVGCGCMTSPHTMAACLPPCSLHVCPIRNC